MNKWSKEFALRYMTAHSDEFYLRKLQHRFDKFNVKEVCQKHFKAFKNIGSVCDIGAGVLGGALALFPYGDDRMIIDLLSREYEDIEKLPEGVVPVYGDFGKTGLEDDSIDVLFSWECLDHADTIDHFIQGQKELVRILKPGGLLFFYLPLRNAPKNAHLVIRTEEKILNEFSDLKLISRKIERDWNRYEKAIYGIFTKEDTLD